MAWDSVPWAVGGGAQHSPEMARVALHVSTGSAEGVATATDLRVAPLAVPGGSVRVLPGAALILSRASGGTSQTYAARLPSEDVVAITPTGSGSGRSDLIVARIEDPFMAGEPWADPTDPTVGPYVYTRVIPNVGAGATTHASVGSGIVLARVDLPASTGTVTSGMIVDLRKVARPRRQRDLYNTQPSVTTTVSNSTYKDIAPQAARSLAVPAWATQVKVIGHIGGAIVSGGDFNGNVGPVFGGTALATNGLNQDAYTRTPALVSDTFAIPAAMRGTSQTLYLRANKTGGSGTFGTDSYTTVIWDVEFLEVPSAD